MAKPLHRSYWVVNSKLKFCVRCSRSGGLQRSIAGIAGSNPADGIVALLEFIMFCVLGGLRDELIIRPEESYLVCVCLVCNLETSKRGGLGPSSAVTPQNI